MIMDLIGLRQCLKKNFNMESLHKRGDIVTIKNKYDKDCTGADYTCCFNEIMLNKYGGKKMKIKSVHKRENFLPKGKLHTEDYYYILYDDDFKWHWTDGMFEECELWKVNIKLAI